MNVEIVIDSEEGTHEVRPVAANGPLTIGRSPSCEIHLDSDLVSRRHAVIQVLGTTVRVEDTSTNGTMAAGTVLRRTVADIELGAPIVVGNYTLTVHAPRPAPRAGAAFPTPRSGSAGYLPPGVGKTMPPPANIPPPPKPGNHQAPIAGQGELPPGRRRGARARRAPDPRSPAPANPSGYRAPGKPPVPKPPAKKKRNREEHNKYLELRREIHRKLLEHLDLAAMDASKIDDPSMRPKVLSALRRIVGMLKDRLPPDLNEDRLVGELADEALGLGPLERFIDDPSITEIMVVDPETIYVERKGKLVKTESQFTDDERVRAVIERIVTPLGRRIDESSPLVDARLKDGSRVNAVIRPIALRGSCITIRKFSKTPLTLENLISFDALSERMGRFMTRAVRAKKNIVISGGTGSGKTTLLNVLSAAIPPEERIITIEDAAELQLEQPHVVSLETRPANMEGKGAYTIRDLVRNALRMRPDRIVVGECRGGETLDMLQAMNTGHDGSLTTTHANSPHEAIQRLETLSLMAGVDLPSKAIKEQIANSVHLIIQQKRFSDGTRKITDVSEVLGIGDDGMIEMLPIFQFIRTGTGSGGKVQGVYRATGYLPTFLDQFIVMGLVRKGEPYL